MNVHQFLADMVHSSSADRWVFLSAAVAGVTGSHRRIWAVAWRPPWCVPWALCSPKVDGSSRANRIRTLLSAPKPIATEAKHRAWEGSRNFTSLVAAHKTAAPANGRAVRTRGQIIQHLHLLRQGRVAPAVIGAVNRIHALPPRESMLASLALGQLLRGWLGLQSEPHDHVPCIPNAAHEEQDARQRQSVEGPIDSEEKPDAGSSK